MVRLKKGRAWEEKGREVHGRKGGGNGKKKKLEGRRKKQCKGEGTEKRKVGGVYGRGKGKGGEEGVKKETEKSKIERMDM